jgi:hypothetical protein
MSSTTLFPLRKESNGRRPKRADEWKALAARQIEEAGLPPADCEYKFAKSFGRQWRFDFAWPDLKVAFEIEGAVFGRAIDGADGKKYRLGGRHSTGKGLQEDAVKYNRAAIFGWLVIRATTTMVWQQEAIPELIDAFKARGVAPLSKSDLKSAPLE